MKCTKMLLNYLNIFYKNEGRTSVLVHVFFSSFLPFLVRKTLLPVLPYHISNTLKQLFKLFY